jgi:hypothetical protein
MLEAAENHKPSPRAKTVRLIYNEARAGSPVPGRGLRSSCPSSAPAITSPHWDTACTESIGPSFLLLLTAESLAAS